MAQRTHLERNPEWMDLKTTLEYADVSDRTLREWIHRSQTPLPASQVEHGKIFIKRSKFDLWLEAQPMRSIESIDVNKIANDIISQFREAA